MLRNYLGCIKLYGILNNIFRYMFGSVHLERRDFLSWQHHLWSYAWGFSKKRNWEQTNKYVFCNSVSLYFWLAIISRFKTRYTKCHHCYWILLEVKICCLDGIRVMIFVNHFRTTLSYFHYVFTLSSPLLICLLKKDKVA